jgi:hypothetical protein
LTDLKNKGLKFNNKLFVPIIKKDIDLDLTNENENTDKINIVAKMKKIKIVCF